MDKLLANISLDKAGLFGGGIILLIIIAQHLLKNNNILKDDADRSQLRQDLMAANKELTERCDKVNAERNAMIVKHSKECSDYEKQIQNLQWRLDRCLEANRECDCPQPEDSV